MLGYAEPRAKPKALDFKTDRDRLVRRWGALKLERESWITHWRDLSKFMSPRTGRYLESDRNKGEKKHGAIYNNTAATSVLRLAAGMMSGANSPARPWHKLAAGIRALRDEQRVRAWLNDVEEEQRDILRASNTYEVFEQMYEELGTYGTAVSVLLPDDETLIHHYQCTVGEYALQADARGKVNTLIREFEMTAGQVVKEFGPENCSNAVKQAVDSGNREAPFNVLHVIEPREHREHGKLDNRNMPWRSVYFEAACSEDKWLRDSGYRRFPALTPRWSVRGSDVYGRSPGMDALGDTKGLQFKEELLAIGVEKQADPPMLGTAALAQKDHSTQPGEWTFADSNGSQPAARPLYSGEGVRLDHLSLTMEKDERRIRDALYRDLFEAVLNEDKRMTAHEVAMRIEEKMQMLGPVIERLQNELHKPLIEFLFERMIETGRLPPPPPELEDSELTIEFVSTLAQAQKAVPLAAVDRWLGVVGTMAKMQADSGAEVDVWDNVASDEIVSDYGDKAGVPAKYVRSADKVAAMRKARNDARAAEAQIAAQREQAATVKDLANAPMGEGSALDAMATEAISQVSGYQTGPPAIVGAA